MKKIYLTMLVYLVGCGYRPVSSGVTSAPPHGPVTPVDIAITVDDLPSMGDLPGQVTRDDVVQTFIAAFQHHHVLSVMGFLNAVRVDQHPALRSVLDAWRNAGFRLGNHTYSHTNLEQVTLPVYEADVERNEATLAAAALNGDYRWFRFPYLAEGETPEKRQAFRAYLAEKNYRAVPVDFDFKDYEWDDPYARCLHAGDAPAVEFLQQSYLQSADDALANSLAAGEGVDHRAVPLVLLLHIGAFDALMLGDLLTNLEGRGARFVAVENVLSDPVYAVDPGAATRGYRNFLDQVLVARGQPVPSLRLPTAAVQAACLPPS